MPLSDTRRLLDLSTRIALYTEQVKSWQAVQFKLVMYEIAPLLKQLLGNIEYRTLDGLSKAELNNLILKLRVSQSQIYSDYTECVIKQLQEWMKASLIVNRRVWVTSMIESDTDKAESEDVISDEEAIQWILDHQDDDITPLFGWASVTGNDTRMWSTITNTPIAANGLYLLPLIKMMTTTAKAGIENFIHQAWANRMTVDETLSQLVGDRRFGTQGTPSKLSRTSQQSHAMMNTMMAHVASITAAGVLSALFGKYIWLSVMDSRTSDICIDRNMTIYRFGQGPLPPAHVNCRSQIAPAMPVSDLGNEVFYTWLARQPEALQEDVFTSVDKKAWREGKLQAKELQQAVSHMKINENQFIRKIKNILVH